MKRLWYSFILIMAALLFTGYIAGDEIVTHPVQGWSHTVFTFQKKPYQLRIPHLIDFFMFVIFVLILAVLLLICCRIINRLLESRVQDRTAALERQKMQLNSKTEEALDALQAKGEYLSHMSHEIRTPLNAIIGLTNISMMSNEHSEAHRTQLAEILKASTHLLEIVNNVLDISKIESGKLTIVREPFNLYSAMDEVAGIFQQRCEENNITFSSNYSHLENTYVVGDRLRLKQVLINLLGNAVKFTPGGGAVQLLVEARPGFPILFQVKDTGIGMTEEQIDRLFRAFEQADNSITTRFGGSGLGLAISQQLMKKMDSEIKVDSKRGVGSTFYFSLDLPATEKIEEKVSDMTGWNTCFDLTGKRILLAEDIEINRTILIELLKDSNVTIDEAEDGQQAVEKFERSSEGYYDLIFMDMQMPNMNGYEATAAIRASRRSDASSIPIIAMTANAYSDDIAKEKEVGMDDHISKPIDIDIVKKTLQKYLSISMHS